MSQFISLEIGGFVHKHPRSLQGTHFSFLHLDLNPTLLVSFSINKPLPQLSVKG